MFLHEEIYLLEYEKSSNKKLFYAPIRGYAELIDQQDAEVIEQGNIFSMEDLDKNDNVRKLIQGLRKIPLKDLDIMQKGFPILNIDFSNGCNMKCIYCYADRGEGSIKYQKKENIDLIISAYFNYLQQQANFLENEVCYITFSNNAEPTFSPDLLIYTVEKIRETALRYGLKPLFSMPTNGAFVSDIRSFIIKNFDRISLSFDGLESIQNEHRPFSDGSPSYEIVYQNAKVLYNSGIKIGFNVVVTAKNLNSLKNTVDYFHQNFSGTEISFSPVNLAGRALKEQRNLMIDHSLFQSRLIEAIDYAKETSIKILDKDMQNYHIPRRHYCTSTARPNWNVNLKGEIFACMESKIEAMKIGEINFNTHELRLCYDNIQALKAYSVAQNGKCINCFAKYLCAGGCKVRNEKTSKNCNDIRLKCLHLINQVYEEEQWFSKGQTLFKIERGRGVRR